MLADRLHLVGAVAEMRWREWGDEPGREELSWWVDVTAAEAGQRGLPGARSDAWWGLSRCVVPVAMGVLLHTGGWLVAGDRCRPRERDLGREGAAQRP